MALIEMHLLRVNLCETTKDLYQAAFILFQDSFHFIINMETFLPECRSNFCNTILLSQIYWNLDILDLLREHSVLFTNSSTHDLQIRLNHMLQGIKECEIDIAGRLYRSDLKKLIDEPDIINLELVVRVVFLSGNDLTFLLSYFLSRLIRFCNTCPNLIHK